MVFQRKGSRTFTSESLTTSERQKYSAGEASAERAKCGEAKRSQSFPQNFSFAYCDIHPLPKGGFCYWYFREKVSLRNICGNCGAILRKSQFVSSRLLEDNKKAS